MFSSVTKCRAEIDHEIPSEPSIRYPLLGINIICECDGAHTLIEKEKTTDLTTEGKDPCEKNLKLHFDLDL